MQRSTIGDRAATMTNPSCSRRISTHSRLAFAPFNSIGEPAASPSPQREERPWPTRSDLPVRQFRDSAGRLLVQFFAQKYIASPFAKISIIDSAIPHPREGRIAIVTDVGRGMRWTRQCQARRAPRRMMLPRTAKSCGPGAPKQALSWR
jgi:hypothetical protein